MARWLRPPPAPPSRVPEWTKRANPIHAHPTGHAHPTRHLVRPAMAMGQSNDAESSLAPHRPPTKHRRITDETPTRHRQDTPTDETRPLDEMRPSCQDRSCRARARTPSLGSSRASRVQRVLSKRPACSGPRASERPTPGTTQALLGHPPFPIARNVPARATTPFHHPDYNQTRPPIYTPTSRCAPSAPRR